MGHGTMRGGGSLSQDFIDEEIGRIAGFFVPCFEGGWSERAGKC